MKLTKNNIFLIASQSDCERAVSLLELVSEEEKQDPEVSEVYKIIKELIASWDQKQLGLKKPTPAEVLKTLMESEGVTQERLASATGVRQPNISRCLSGQNKMSRKLAEKFAAFFDVPIQLFVTEETPNSLPIEREVMVSQTASL